MVDVRTILRDLRHRLSAPTASPHEEVPPYVTEAIQWHRENHDREENAEGTPPEDEEIVLHAVWVVEAFPPSKIGNLAEALERLGGTYEPVYNPGPSDWLADSRRQSWGGGWRTLGLIAPHGAKGFDVEHRADLPAGVEYAMGALHQVLPSVTVAVFCFVFAESGDDRLVETALRKQYATSLYRWRNMRWSFLTPGNLRIAEVGEARKALRQRCETWVAEKFPGFFAGAASERGFLTCECLSTKVQRAFNVAGAGRSKWLWALRMGHAWDAWQSEALPGLRFGAAFARDDEPYAWIMTGRWSEIFSDDDLSKGYGGRTRRGMMGKLHGMTHGLFAVMGVWILMRELGAQLALLRDRAWRMTIDRGADSAAELMRLQSAVVGQCGDLLPLLDEADGLAAGDHQWRRFETGDFTPVEDALNHVGFSRW